MKEFKSYSNLNTNNNRLNNEIIKTICDIFEWNADTDRIECNEYVISDPSGEMERARFEVYNKETKVCRELRNLSNEEALWVLKDMERTLEPQTIYSYEVECYGETRRCENYFKTFTRASMEMCDEVEMYVYGKYEIEMYATHIDSEDETVDKPIVRATKFCREWYDDLYLQRFDRVVIRKNNKEIIFKVIEMLVY